MSSGKEANRAFEQQNYFLPRYFRVFISLRPFECCIVLCISLISFLGCQPTDEQAQNDYPQEDNTSDSSAIWTDEVAIRHAQGFDVRYFEAYKLLQFFQGSDTIHYLSLLQGTERPKVYPDAQVIRIPYR
jgi:hypothetical protein